MAAFAGTEMGNCLASSSRRLPQPAGCGGGTCQDLSLLTVGRRRKVPAAKKASAARKPADQGAAPSAKKTVQARSGAPSPRSTPTKRAPTKLTGTADKRLAAATGNAASGGASPSTRKSLPKQAPSPKAPSEGDLIESRFFQRARKRAEKLLSDPEKMRGVAAEASSKSRGARSGPLTKILDEVAALIRLVVAYARGTYREVSGQSMILILAGLIYFVSPVDLIPDFIAVAGYTDDAVVLGFVVRTVREELEDFMAWETGQGGGSEATASKGG